LVDEEDNDGNDVSVIEYGLNVEVEIEVKETKEVTCKENEQIEEEFVDKDFVRWNIEEVKYYQQWLSLKENTDLISVSMPGDENIEWGLCIPTS